MYPEMIMILFLGSKISWKLIKFYRFRLRERELQLQSDLTTASRHIIALQFSQRF